MPIDPLQARSPQSPAVKVLIAEDEPLLQMSLEDILQDLGYDVIASVPTVVETAAVAAVAEFQLAVLDVQLADGDVTPVVELLTARGIPIVFATGDTGYDTRGIGPVVSKPYNEEEIRCAIASCLPREGVLGA